MRGEWVSQQVLDRNSFKENIKLAKLELFKYFVKLKGDQRDLQCSSSFASLRYFLLNSYPKHVETPCLLDSMRTSKWKRVA